MKPYIFHNASEAETAERFASLDASGNSVVRSAAGRPC